MRADLEIANGNLAEDIRRLADIETVYKHGIGYDAKALFQSDAGQVGLR